MLFYILGENIDLDMYKTIVVKKNHLLMCFPNLDESKNKFPSKGIFTLAHSMMLAQLQ